MVEKYRRDKKKWVPKFLSNVQVARAVGQIYNGVIHNRRTLLASNQNSKREVQIDDGSLHLRRVDESAMNISGEKSE